MRNSTLARSTGSRKERAERVGGRRTAPDFPLPRPDSSPKTTPEGDDAATVWLSAENEEAVDDAIRERSPRGRGPGRGGHAAPERRQPIGRRCPGPRSRQARE